jgi:hypothetical protein
VGKIGEQVKRRVLCACLAAMVLTPVGGAMDFSDDQDNEEPAGASCSFQFNPQQDLYGVAIGCGAWIRDTPIFGDYFLDLFSDRIEDAAYSGLGMTIRLMPHGSVAPFVGGGASYNYSLANHGTNETTEIRGQSYWAGHAEAGIRFWIPNRIQLVELMGRYTWSASKTPDADYWLVSIGVGAGI